MQSWFPLVVLSTLFATGCALLPTAGPSSGPRELRQVAPSGSLAPGEHTFRIIPGQSEAWYEAQEKWLRWHAPTKAMAKTDDVEGELVLVVGEQTRVAANRFRVDMRTLVSQHGETPLWERPAGLLLSQRDSAVRTVLAAEQHRFAEFTATSVEGVPPGNISGQALKLRVMGDLTIRGVTRPATFETEATLQGDTLSGTATTQVLMTDFGVTPPVSAAGNAMDVEDQLTLRVRFTATATPTPSPASASAERHPKLDRTLGEVARTVREQGAAPALALGRERGLGVEDVSVRVIVIRERGEAFVDSARADIDAAGGRIERESVAASGLTGRSFLVLLPVAAIEALAESEAITELRTPLQDEAEAGG